VSPVRFDPPGAEHLPSLDPASAIAKLQHRSEWSLVKCLRALDRVEPRAELIVQRVGIVTHDIEAAAFRRTFRPECADDDMASAFHGERDIPNRGHALFLRGAAC
jgi:hypothetical protein